MSTADAEQADTQDIRPVVAKRPGNRSVFVFAAILAGVAGVLFATLEMRRSEISSPSIVAPADTPLGSIAAPPDLAIPQNYPGYDTGYYPYPQYPSAVSSVLPQEAMPARAPRHSGGRYEGVASVSGTSYAGPWSAPSYPQEQPVSPGYAYQAPAPPSGPKPEAGEDRSGSARANYLRNPATTVSQGTVIQAVLETALDSTRPGYARALVSRDIRGFDGSQVLIPRGSRLFGEYASDVSLGQKRALIRWRRLTRPDGAIIDLDSPSADSLGRAGVKGKVNSHFFQRFSGAILQSALDVGVRLATREAVGDTVVVALPSGAQSVTIQKPDDIKPTLKVRQGSSVSVIVARDLDFSPVED